MAKEKTSIIDSVTNALNKSADVITRSNEKLKDSIKDGSIKAAGKRIGDKLSTGSPSIAGVAKNSIFEFPSFVSSSVPLDYATATNCLLELTYSSYLSMAISMDPVIDEDAGTNVFAKWKTDTNNFLECTTFEGAITDGIHSVTETTDGCVLEYDILSIDDFDAKLINEHLDYEPLSEFNHFFMESKKHGSKDPRHQRQQPWGQKGIGNGQAQASQQQSSTTQQQTSNSTSNSQTNSTSNGNGRKTFSVKKVDSDASRKRAAASLEEELTASAARSEENRRKENVEKEKNASIERTREAREEIYKDEKGGSPEKDQLTRDKNATNKSIREEKAADAFTKFCVDHGFKDGDPSKIIELITNYGRMEDAKTQREQDEKLRKILEKNKVPSKDVSDAIVAMHNAFEKRDSTAARLELSKFLKEKGLPNDEVTRYLKDLYSAKSQQQRVEQSDEEKKRDEAMREILKKKGLDDPEISEAILKAYQAKDAEEKDKARKNLEEAIKTSELYVRDKSGNPITAFSKDIADTLKAYNDFIKSTKELEDYDEDKVLARNRQRADSATKHPEVMSEDKIQKLNSMKPLLMNVQLKKPIKVGNRTELDTLNVVAGVKVFSRIVDASILPEVAEFPLKEMDNQMRNAKYRAGELKFFKDLVFKIDTKKQTAVDSHDPKRKWYRRLYELAHTKGDSMSVDKLTKGKGFLSKLAGEVTGAKKADSSGYGFMPSATIVMAKSDVDNIYNEKKIDLLDAKQALKFCNELFLMNLVVIDTDAQSIKILTPDQHHAFEVHSLSSVNKQMAMLDTSSTSSREIFKMLK